jgi:ArsR family transcriptional regulator, arsenate/arsenite/antimonite-responsive transcriptional repressor
MKQSDVIAALTCLSNDTELNVFRLLVRSGAEGLPGDQVGQRLHLSLSALMLALNQLKEAGLVAFHGEGESVVYTAKGAVMNKVLAYLIDTCCEGSLLVRDVDHDVAPTLQ